MCFICQILSGQEPLTPEQRREFFPVACAMFNASTEAINLNLDAISQFGNLANLRGAPDAVQVNRLARALYNLQVEAMAFHEANDRKAGMDAVRDIKLSFDIPAENADVVEHERKSLTFFHASITTLAQQLSLVPASVLRRLYNRQRSPRAQQIISILTEARNRIISVTGRSAVRKGCRLNNI